MVKVLVDSASSITPAMAAELGLHLIPVKVTFGGESHLDGVDLDAATFYRKLTSGEPLPVTSQPSPGDFTQLFAQPTADGSELLCVLMSHQMSGIIHSAELAREALPGRTIRIFDSLNASIGEALLAMATSTPADVGWPMAEILARLEALRAETRVYFGRYAGVPATRRAHRRGRCPAGDPAQDQAHPAGGRRAPGAPG